ncbi:MAG TPA: hypothetical protein PK177_20915, partial [Burkholderiaceae bacterium]|nr:hypothetical protein [Burkholderiaceae bacterium]
APWSAISCNVRARAGCRNRVPGASASPAELLGQAAQRVPERAAVPKQCYLLDEMPKSVVGKVLANRLRIDAAEKTFRAALSALGLEAPFELSVVDRGAGGLRVEVALDESDASQEARVAAALRGFPLPHLIRRKNHD